jgi:inner membrane protein
MTQRTHDLAGVALVSYWFLSHPQSMNWETILGIGVATLLGAAVPDIDNVSSPAWRHKLMPWEGKASREFLEGHRNLSHSVLGLGLFYFVLKLLLTVIHIPNLDLIPVTTAFLLGMLSHLLTDSLTEQGVPWLYPVPWKMGFPPIKKVRIKTGKWFEKLVVMPLLLVLTVWIYYTFRDNINLILKS